MFDSLFINITFNEVILNIYNIINILISVLSLESIYIGDKGVYEFEGERVTIGNYFYERSKIYLENNTFIDKNEPYYDNKAYIISTTILIIIDLIITTSYIILWKIEAMKDILIHLLVLFRIIDIFFYSALLNNLNYKDYIFTNNDLYYTFIIKIFNSIYYFIIYNSISTKILFLSLIMLYKICYIFKIFDFIFIFYKKIKINNEFQMTLL